MPPITELTRIEPIGRGATEHDVVRPAGIDGYRALLPIELDPFRGGGARPAGRLRVEAPSDLMIETWWEQARTLEDE